jgi:hypothetical protein
MKISRKRAERLLTDGLLRQLAPIGFVELEPGVLVRLRDGWREGVFVQLSSPPAQEACLVAGVDVPRATEYASGEQPRTFSVAVGGRLSERGLGQGDRWFRVETVADVDSAIAHVVDLLGLNAQWFERFRNAGDVAEAYYHIKSLQPVGQNDYWKQVFVLNYACMLLAAGEHSLAMDWLREAERVIRSGQSLDKDDRARLARIAALLEESRGAKCDGH